MYHHTLGMIISVRLVSRLVKPLIVVPFMLLIPYGMAVVVGLLAHAALSIIRHGFVSNYHDRLMLIWRYDCVRMVLHLPKIVLYN